MNDLSKDEITQRINEGTITNAELLMIPGRYIGRIPGETDWHDVEWVTKQYKDDLLKLKTLKEEKNNICSDEFKKSHYIQIKTIHTRLRLKRNYRDKNRRVKDLKFKTITGLRSIMRNAILYGTDNPRLLRYLGCTPEQAKTYLEKQFKEGMVWENTAIDHIIPLISYNPFDPIQMEKAFNFRNLQPLFKRDNSVKGTKFSPESKAAYDNSFVYNDGELKYIGKNHNFINTSQH